MRPGAEARLPARGETLRVCAISAPLNLRLTGIFRPGYRTFMHTVRGKTLQTKCLYEYWLQFCFMILGMFLGSFDPDSGAAASSMKPSLGMIRRPVASEETQDHLFFLFVKNNGRGFKKTRRHDRGSADISGFACSRRREGSPRRRWSNK